VSGLAVTSEYLPAGEGECSVPLSGQVQAVLHITASKSSVGATVTLQTSQGTFAGGTSTQSLILMASEEQAEQTTFLIPQRAGLAVVSASAVGAVAKPVVVPVTPPPEISAPVTSLKRGVNYAVTVRSSGHLRNCTLQHAISAATATIEVVKPDSLKGGLDNNKSLKQRGDCLTDEIVELNVSFSTGTPDDAAVTIRCFDTFGQTASTTFQVVKAM
jgi:hypothetical protein